MVKCHGSYGCYGADIDAVNIVANGAYSLNTASIESENQVRVNVYSKGYLSGMNANVVCRADKICNVYCAGNGCKDLNFGCLAGSQCLVSPSTCSPNVDIDKPVHKDGSVVKDDDSETVVCPNWYNSGSKKMDSQLLTQFEQQRLDIVQKMEFDSPRNIQQHLLDPIKYTNNRVDSDWEQEPVLSSKINVETGFFGNNSLDISTLIMDIIVFCSIVTIGFGSWFYCYKKHCYSESDYELLD